jgi:hypothetical protein
MTYSELQDQIVTAQQEKALNEFYSEPDNFWHWYSYYCYENNLFNDK